MAINARVVDISLQGVQVEAASPLPVHAKCDLRLLLGKEDVRLSVTVRRCAVQGRGEWDGKRTLLYRAGLQFEAPSKEVLQVLRQRFPGIAERVKNGWNMSGPHEEGTGGLQMIIEVEGEEPADPSKDP